MSDRYQCPICKEYFDNRSQWVNIIDNTNSRIGVALCEYWHQGYPRIERALEEINKKLDMNREKILESYITAVDELILNSIEIGSTEKLADNYIKVKKCLRENLK